MKNLIEREIKYLFNNVHHVLNCIPSTISTDKFGCRDIYNYLKKLDKKIEKHQDTFKLVIENKKGIAENLVKEGLQEISNSLKFIQMIVNTAKSENILNLHKNFDWLAENYHQDDRDELLLFYKTKIYNEFTKQTLQNLRDS